jgi:SWI/SNF-related matrix-associated actin-dependent regulator of chromatin subfamily D
MAELITPHLSPLPPIQLPYTIRVDPDYQASPVPTIYDIIVPAENVVRAKVLTVTQNPPYLTTLRQISNLDDQLGLLVQAINNSKAKHSFLTGMGKDPGNFIRKWTSSQKWDLDIIVGDAIRGGGDVVEDEFRRGGKDGVWGTDNVRESVGLMVAKKR